MDAKSGLDPSVMEIFIATIIVAVPIAFFVSLGLLWIYRRTVLRTMQRRVTQSLDPERAGSQQKRPSRGESPPHPLEIVLRDPSPAWRAARKAAWPFVAIEVCAGLTYAIVMTLSSLATLNVGFEGFTFLYMTVWHAWPLVITVGIAVIVSWRDLAMLVAGYFLAMAAAAAPILVYTTLTAGQLLQVWLTINGPCTLLVLTFLARPIRAVGSLVLVFMIAAVGGAIFLIVFFNENQQFFLWIYQSVFYAAALLMLLGLVAIGLIGGLYLRLIVAGHNLGQRIPSWIDVKPVHKLWSFARNYPISGTVAILIVMAVAASIVNIGFFDSDDQKTLPWSIIRKLGVFAYLGGLLLVGAIPTAIIGWLLLRGLGSLYRARRISDQSIMTDAIWLMFSFAHSPLSMSLFSLRPDVSGFAIAIGAFVAYKLVASIGFWVLHTSRDDQAPKLLLLRVFSLGTRSERLFAGFTKLWRYMGNTQMLAGPDLATSTVEPHEFLDFLAGRLQRRFISGPDTLEQRISETEKRRDVDGRFRIADFFCHEDTWQMVLRRLAGESDVVLMDLRSFSRSNSGCMVEINELLEMMLLRRIVFVVDRTTDERFLSQVLTDAWAAVTEASPNWSDSAPRVSLYRFHGHTGQNIPALIAVIANAGLPRRHAA